MKLRRTTLHTTSLLLLLLLLPTSVICGRDYYDLLGVPRDAEDSIIKKAYRQMARRYHPDKHPGDSKMEQKFKDISTAYEVLNDRKKRQVYDQYGEEGLKQNRNEGGGSGFRRGHPGGDEFQFNFDSEMFDNMFGGGRGGGGGGGGGRQRGGGRQYHQQQQQEQRRRVCFENKICENGQCYMEKECKS